VGKANAKRLGRIPGDSHFYSSRDNGKMDSEAQDKALENTMAPKELELKRGAQVMLIKNYDSGLANGCLGIVTEFEHTSSWAGEKLGTPMRKEGVYPVVQFSTRGEAGDRVTRTALVLTEKWEVLKASGGVLASRRQVSLGHCPANDSDTVEYEIGQPHSRVGDFNPQVARANTGSCQSGLGPGV